MLSGSQVTQHGISGYTQVVYSSFTGKSTQIVEDIDGRVTLSSPDSLFSIDAIDKKTLNSATSRITIEPI